MKRLEVLRRDLGLTQAELGAKAHMTQSRISMIESGVYTPPRGGKELPRLAKVLHLKKSETESLLDEVVEPEKEMAIG